jgi:hypothetical protein
VEELRQPIAIFAALFLATTTLLWSFIRAVEEGTIVYGILSRGIFGGDAPRGNFGRVERRLDWTLGEANWMSEKK